MSERLVIYPAQVSCCFLTTKTVVFCFDSLQQRLIHNNPVTFRKLIKLALEHFKKKIIVTIKCF